jgi:hypothetical protein
MKGLIVLELNEVSPVVFARMIASGTCQHLASLRDSHVELFTDAGEDLQHLEPWIQWITLRTGLPRGKHNVFNLSDGQHATYDQIWDHLEDQGVACGVVGSINSHKGRINKGFYVPDPWSASGEVFPHDLTRIYHFLRDRVRSHDVSLEEGETKLGFLVDSIRQKVRMKTILGLGFKYLQSRVDRRNRWRLVMDYDSYLVDLGLALRQRYQTPYTSIYLTSVAHFQHRYWTRHDRQWWSQQAPGLFQHTNPLEAEDLRPGDDPVAEGVLNYDALIGRIKERCPDADLVLLSGLGQVPFQGNEQGGGFYLYRPYDHDRLFAKLGLKCVRIVPLISRDLMIYFDDESQRQAAIALLRRTTVGGEPLFAWTEESDGRLFVKVEYTLPASAGSTIVIPDGSTLVFAEWLQLITFKTGDHDNRGFIYVPRKYEPLAERNTEGEVDLESVYDMLINITRAASGISVDVPATKAVGAAS